LRLRIKKGYVKRLIFKGLLLFIVGLFGCGEIPIVEVPETNETIYTSVHSLSEVLSTFDVIQDLALNPDIFNGNHNSLLPSTVLVLFSDTSFTDGDGMDFILDFGDLGLEPHGVLCKDQKYRAGKIALHLSKPYNANDAKLSVNFVEESPYYTGDGEHMSKFEGGLSLTRVSDIEVLMHCANLKFTDDDVVNSIETMMSIVDVETGGKGLIDNILGFDGAMTISDGNSSTTLSTNTPLQKKYTLECAKHIVKGELDVNSSKSISEVHIDFDPDRDEACDNRIKLTVNGKSIYYDY